MKFGRRWYRGVVTDHDVSTDAELIWHVKFDDGDECDLNLFELLKKIEKESVVCRRTALFLRDFRWQTRNTDNSGQTQRTARCIPRDKTGHKILEKAAVRTTWVESPYHIPLRSSFRTVETSRQMSAKVMP